MIDLDDESRAFAERLFARFPEWRSRCSLRAREGTRSLNLTLPSPVQSPERDLWFWMEDAKPSIEFGGFHTHADLWDSEVEFLDFVEAILADRQLFVAGWPNGAWHVAERDLDAELAEALTAPGGPSRLSVVSWSGAFDRDVTVDNLRT